MSKRKLVSVIYFTSISLVYINGIQFKSFGSLIDRTSSVYKGPSWSWSYESWIHNYLFNQCLSPLTLWVRIPFIARCTWYKIMW